MTAAYGTVRRYLIGAYVSFLGMTVVCMLLYPEIFNHYSYGISAFGSFPETFVPYYLGFAVTAACLVVIGRELRRLGRQARPLVLAFWANAILMALIAVSSYSLSGAMAIVHLVFASLLTLNQLIISIWILSQPGAAGLDYVLTLIFVAVVIISLVPFMHDLPVVRSFPLREVIAYVCALGLAGRSALRLTQPKARETWHS